MTTQKIHEYRLLCVSLVVIDSCRKVQLTFRHRASSTLHPDICMFPRRSYMEGRGPHIPSASQGVYPLPCHSECVGGGV